MPDYAFKIPPEAGETVDAWMTRAYAPEARGPGNKTILPNVVYVGLTEPEFSLAIDQASIPPLVWNGLLIVDDPTMYVAPLSGRIHAILAFDMNDHLIERRPVGVGGERIACAAPHLDMLCAAWVRPHSGGDPVMLGEEAFELLRAAPAPGTPIGSMR